ncbi:MAG: penicillin-binding protein 2 [Deltaproteobacteria bacterium]|nr:penicillin-binding protein 2 [Deltaproteobacteria bacterium]
MKEYKNKLIIATIILIQAFVILAGRMWYMQILKGNEYEKFSRDNRVRITRFPAPRGRILDRRGRELVINRSSFDVYILPNDIKDVDPISNSLSQTLEIDAGEIKKKISEAYEANRFVPTPIAKDINRDQLAYIEARKISLQGVFIQINHTREYPYKEIGAPFIGYLGKAGKEDISLHPNLAPGALVGKDGVERSSDEYLLGDDGYKQKITDAHGREVKWRLLQKDLKSQDSVPGADVVLSIDIDLQKSAEESLGERAGAVVAVDVRTGELLVLVSHPTFNPEDFIDGMDSTKWNKLMSNSKSPLLNRATQGLYAPGSVFKIVTSSAALNEGVINSHSRFYCPGSYRIGNRRFRCWKKGGHGSLNLHQAIVQSCDVYFYHVAEKLGISRFAKYIREFGFGAPTGVALNERAGIAPSREWKLDTLKKPWYLGETIITSIGQGYLSVSPLQIALMTASIANGGTLLKPQIVKKVTAADGKVLLNMSPQKNGRIPVNEEAINLIMKALKGVVNDPGGTGWASRVDNIEVAGKTGTAQVIALNSNSDKISHKDHAWFTSYAPADNPEIAVTVIVEHGGGGGAVAAPIVKKILETYFRLKEEGNV